MWECSSDSEPLYILTVPVSDRPVRLMEKEAWAQLCSSVFWYGHNSLLTVLFFSFYCSACLYLGYSRKMERFSVLYFDTDFSAHFIEILSWQLLKLIPYIFKEPELHFLKEPIKLIWQKCMVICNCQPLEKSRDIFILSVQLLWFSFHS